MSSGVSFTRASLRGGEISHCDFPPPNDLFHADSGSHSSDHCFVKQEDPDDVPESLARWRIKPEDAGSGRQFSEHSFVKQESPADVPESPENRRIKQEDGEGYYVSFDAYTPEAMRQDGQEHTCTKAEIRKIHKKRQQRARRKQRLEIAAARAEALRAAEELPSSKSTTVDPASAILKLELQEWAAQLAQAADVLKCHGERLQQKAMLLGVLEEDRQPIQFKIPPRKTPLQKEQRESQVISAGQAKRRWQQELRRLGLWNASWIRSRPPLDGLDKVAFKYQRRMRTALA